MTFRHSKKWYFWASWIAWGLGAVLCVLPPIVATLANFPMMVTNNADSTISIFFVLGILIASSVLMQSVVKAFKNNSLLVVAVVLAAVCAILCAGVKMEKETIAGLAWIAGSASAGVLCAMVCFKVHKIWNDLYKNCGEVYVK